MRSNTHMHSISKLEIGASEDLRPEDSEDKTYTIDIDITGSDGSEHRITLFSNPNDQIEVKF